MASKRRVPVMVLWGLPAVVLIGLAVFVAVRATQDSLQTVRIATGGEGGTYYPLGMGIADVINKDMPEEARVEVLQTAGSTDNLQRLAAGDCEMAIVQNDAVLGSDVRAMLPLYPEILHTVVRSGAGIETIDDLVGHRVAAGPENSGTAALVRSLMQHFGLDSGVEWVHVSTMEGVRQFEAGQLDGVFVVSGLTSSAVERLLAGGHARLLSLGSPDQVGSALEGLRVTFPFLDKSVIPVGTYGSRPHQPVGTVAVQAVLVTRQDIDADLVKHMTGAIFRNRVALMNAHRAARYLSEQFDPSSLQAPLHEGAEAYYRRDAPPFFVKYAELMSLLLYLMLATASGSLALRKWFQRKKKNRIDVYYTKIRKAMEAFESDDSSAVDTRTTLLRLRTRAFEDLIDERVAADQSFTIFQDYITSEIAMLDRLVELESKGTAAASA